MNGKKTQCCTFLLGHSTNTGAVMSCHVRYSCRTKKKKKRFNVSSACCMVTHVEYCITTCSLNRSRRTNIMYREREERAKILPIERYLIDDSHIMPSRRRICHEEVLYLQPLIPPKRFDIFSPLTGGCSEGLGAF